LVESSVVVEPYAVVVPYSTREVESSSVVQVITAEVVARLPEVTAEITGGVESITAGVVKVLSVEIASLPAASFDFTL
jgi:hypothetical protein